VVPSLDLGTRKIGGLNMTGDKPPIEVTFPTNHPTLVILPVSIMAEAEAMLAAGQPRLAMQVALTHLSTIADDFASKTGMEPSNGHPIARASVLMLRCLFASTIPTVKDRLTQCTAMLQVALPHATVSITPVGTGLVLKAISETIQVFTSPDVVQHVVTGMTMCTSASKILLSQGLGNAANVKRRGRVFGWPMDPLLATCLYCMLGFAWSGLGLLACMLTLTQGVICCCWFLGIYVAWKVRGWTRVKTAFSRWKAAAFIMPRTVIIILALIAVFSLPVIVKTMQYTPLGFHAEEATNMITIITNRHPTPHMYYVDVAAIIMAGTVGVVIVTVVRARHCDDEARVSSFTRWRAFASVAVLFTWVAVLAWLAVERVYFPCTVFLSDGSGFLSISVGWGWFALGMLGILVA
jgi:hypothetical protein